MCYYRSAACAVAVSFLAASATPVSAQSGRFTPVALTGRQVPGLADGVTYSALFGGFLNESGQVAFIANFQGPGVTPANNAAYMAGPVAAPSVLFREGDPAAGLGAGVTMAPGNFAFPVLTDSGNLLLDATLSGPGVGPGSNEAVYRFSLDSAAPPTLVAREGDLVPGAGGARYGQDVLAAAQSDDGNYTLIARLNTGELLGVRGLAGGDVRIFARTGTQAPGLPAGVSIGNARSLGQINDAGSVNYLTNLSGFGVTSMNNTALYAGPVAGETLVAREGDAAPGTSAGVTYNAIANLPLINENDEAAYGAELRGSGIDSTNDAAIYAGPFGSPMLVAREGDLAPDVVDGPLITGLTVPRAGLTSGFNSIFDLNDAGQVLFPAALSATADRAESGGLFTAGGDRPARLIARTGDAAPGTSGSTFATLPSAAVVTDAKLNEAGQVAFLAQLAGDDVISDTDVGLFLFDPDLGVQLAVREGDLIDVDGLGGAGDLRRVRAIGFFGLFGGLGDDSTLAFQLDFFDGSTGIFTAVDVVPEPGAIGALLAAGGLGLLRRRR